jgi:hypothetical protein
VCPIIGEAVRVIEDVPSQNDVDEFGGIIIDTGIFG